MKLGVRYSIGVFIVSIVVACFLIIGFYDLSDVVFIMVIFLVAATFAIIARYRGENFKKNSVCYEADVIEIVRTGIFVTSRRGATFTIKCAFEDNNGESRTVTVREKMQEHVYEIGRGGIKKIDTTQNLAARVYVRRDDPEKFKVEFYERCDTSSSSDG